MTGEKIVDVAGGFLELTAGDEQACAREQGDGFGFRADVGLTDDLPLLECSADVAGVEAS